MDKRYQYPPKDSVTEQLIDYYDIGGMETIEIIQGKLSQEQYAGFLRGNIIKYMCRAGYKQGCQASQDYEKAAYYSQKLANLYNK